MADTQQNIDAATHHSTEIAANGYPPAPSPVQTWSLSPEHRKQLEQDSAISPEAIAARGWFTVPADANGRQWLLAQGFSPPQSKLGQCLAIPLHNWNSEKVGFMIRPDIPRQAKKRVGDKPAKFIKYESRPGSTPVLDVSVSTSGEINNPEVPLLFTEGAKKSDCAASHGFCAISLNGVFGFRGKNLKGGIGALPDFENIVWKGANGPRLVYIVFDSDVMQNDTVYHALFRLAGLLSSRGALVKMVQLPPGPNGEKTGLDDFFARGGTVDQFKALARDLIGIAERDREKTESKKLERAAKIQAIASEFNIPTIETADDALHNKLGFMSDALEAFNGRKQVLFRGMSGLVTISHDALNDAKIKAVGRAGLAALASQAAVWVYTSEKDGQRQVHPPRDVCESYLEVETYWKGLPPLERISNAPFFRRRWFALQHDRLLPSG